MSIIGLKLTNFWGSLYTFEKRCIPKTLSVYIAFKIIQSSAKRARLPHYRRSGFEPEWLSPRCLSTGFTLPTPQSRLIQHPVYSCSHHAAAYLHPTAIRHSSGLQVLYHCFSGAAGIEAGYSSHLSSGAGAHLPAPSIHFRNLDNIFLL